MKAKIYYQNFYLNSKIFNSAELRINEKSAVLMAEFDFDVTSKDEFCEKAFKELNIGIRISKREFQKKVQSQPFEGKHTSMSVGDYVKFEDNEIWMIAPAGYKKFQSEEK
jgi:hypothetical protein